MRPRAPLRQSDAPAPFPQPRVHLETIVGCYQREGYLWVPSEQLIITAAAAKLAEGANKIPVSAPRVLGHAGKLLPARTHTRVVGIAWENGTT